MPRAILLLLIVCVALAGGEAPFFSDSEWNNGRPTAPTGPGLGAIAGVLGTLIGVIALALGLAWAVKRFGLNRVLPGRGRHVDVVESVTIGPKRAVTLLKIGDQVLVVGQTDHGITHLATLPVAALGAATAATAATATAAPAPTGPTPPPDQRFAGMLMKLTGKLP